MQHRFKARLALRASKAIRESQVGTGPQGLMIVQHCSTIVYITMWAVQWMEQTAPGWRRRWKSLQTHRGASVTLDLQCSLIFWRTAMSSRMLWPRPSAMK